MAFNRAAPVGPMSRQAVIETGSWTCKAGLWEQTFTPTNVRWYYLNATIHLKIIPSFCRVDSDGSRHFGKATVEGDLQFPIKDGRVVDWLLLEGLWRHVLSTELGLTEPWADVAVLLIIPPSWGRDVQAECLRILFEKLAVGAVYLGEAPVLAALGCAQSNALVIDMGESGCDVSVVWEGHLVRASSDRFPVGGRDVDAALLERSPALLHLHTARSMKETEAGLAGVYFPEAGPSLAQFVLALLGTVDADKRPVLLDNIVLTGLASQLPGFAEAFLAEMARVLPVSEYAADHQSRKLSIRHVPEYYPEVWQKAGPVAAWFGAGITAKMVFPDQKAHYTRDEYAMLGGVQLLTRKPL